MRPSIHPGGYSPKSSASQFSKQVLTGSSIFRAAKRVCQLLGRFSSHKKSEKDKMTPEEKEVQDFYKELSLMMESDTGSHFSTKEEVLKSVKSASVGDLNSCMNTLLDQPGKGHVVHCSDDGFPNCVFVKDDSGNIKRYDIGDEDKTSYAPTWSMYTEDNTRIDVLFDGQKIGLRIDGHEAVSPVGVALGELTDDGLKSRVPGEGTFYRDVVPEERVAGRQDHHRAGVVTIQDEPLVVQNALYNLAESSETGGHVLLHNDERPTALYVKPLGSSSSLVKVVPHYDPADEVDDEYGFRNTNCWARFGNVVFNIERDGSRYKVVPPDPNGSDAEHIKQQGERILGKGVCVNENLDDASVFSV